jgi:hypothetical protein
MDIDNTELSSEEPLGDSFVMIDDESTDKDSLSIGDFAKMDPNKELRDIVTRCRKLCDENEECVDYYCGELSEQLNDPNFPPHNFLRVPKFDFGSDKFKIRTLRNKLANLRREMKIIKRDLGREEDIELMNKSISTLWREKCKTGEWEGSFFCELGYKNPIAWLLGSLKFEKRPGDSSFLNKLLNSKNPIIQEILSEPHNIALVKKVMSGEQVSWKDLNDFFAILSNRQMNVIVTTVLDIKGISVKPNRLPVDNKNRETIDLEELHKDICSGESKWNGTLFCDIFDKKILLNSSIAAFILKMKFNVNINEFVIQKLKELLEKLDDPNCGILTNAVEKCTGAGNAIMELMEKLEKNEQPLTWKDLQQTYNNIVKFSGVGNVLNVGIGDLTLGNVLKTPINKLGVDIDTKLPF